jgi:hypothetical protein
MTDSANQNMTTRGSQGSVKFFFSSNLPSIKHFKNTENIF